MVGMLWTKDILLFSCGLKPCNNNNLISANYIRNPSQPAYLKPVIQPAPTINHKDITSLIRHDGFKDNVLTILDLSLFSLLLFCHGLVLHWLLLSPCFHILYLLLFAFCSFLIFISVTSDLLLLYIAVSP